MTEIASIHQTPQPQSIEAEQQVLGALLLGEPSTVVQQMGGPELFYDPIHAALYKTVRRMETADQLVSPVTVAASLPADVKDGLNELGGNTYLVRLAGAAISPHQLPHYVDLLAEQSARRRIIDLVRTAQTEIARGEVTASEVLATLESKLSAMASTVQTKAQPVSMMAAVGEAMQQSFSAYSGEPMAIVPSGLPRLDRLIYGFAPGELWLLGGRPSMGKTGVALSVGLNAARAGHPVVIASYEMTPSSMAMRALSEATASIGRGTAVTYSSIRSGEYSDQQGASLKEAARAVAELPIQFLPRHYSSTDLLPVGAKEALRRIGETGKKPIVIVDYAQLMRSSARGRYEQITEVSLTLKSMAMQLDVPVLALSQLSRAVEQRDDKRPMLSDLRESGQLEQDADGVIFCYRDEYYLAREEPDPTETEKYAQWMSDMDRARNGLDLIVAKQRQGQIGTARMRFNPAMNLIWE